MVACVPSSSASRLDALDALRGIAALIVMIYHYTYLIGTFVPGPLPSLSLRWGCYGVLLFFAISGFVISTSLHRTQTGTEFALRRAIRLLPAYWCAMLLTSAVVAATGAAHFAISVEDVPGNLAMVQFWTNAKMVDGAYWTLNVELAFYICMAGIWRAGLLPRIEWVVAAWLALTLVWSRDWEVAPALRMLLVARDIPFFALGMLAARIWSGERTLGAQLPWIAGTLVVIWLTSTGEVAIAGAVVAATMIGVANGNVTFLVNSSLLWLGRVSYPLYLTHGVIGYVLIARLREAGLSPDGAALVMAALSLLLADALARWYDEPVRKWLGSRASVQPVLRPAQA